MTVKSTILYFTFALLISQLTGCGGGGGSEQNNNSNVSNNASNQNSTSVQNNADNNNSQGGDSNTDNSGDSSGDQGDADQGGSNQGGSDQDNGDQSDSTQSDETFSSKQQVSRFIQQATFGATPTQIVSLHEKSASDWLKAQMEQPASLVLPSVVAAAPDDPDDGFNLFHIEQTSLAFWRNSIAGEDQLRQRVAFALSELLVVSNAGGEVLTDIPEAVAAYQDILIQNAFGNYRHILELVTYSPAMGHYLTYMGSEKGNEQTGRMPDENYARELLQLFTLGIVALNKDGSVKLNSEGAPVELYNNTDITGLARVFTGLNLNEDDPEELINTRFTKPMQIFPESHSEKEKVFLGLTIPAGTGAKASITQALDHIFNHANLAPFVSKQLIQRLVTSNPSPEYTSRVVNAFESGSFELPDGSSVGSSGRGDLAATFAAILFDEEARTQAAENGGKIREPILRFTHWARAFNVENIEPKYIPQLWETGATADLGQHPYRSPSVFNYFRPGYKAPGSKSAELGLVAPELQITNASSIPGYINFMTYFVMGQQQEADVDELKEEFDEIGVEFDLQEALQSFRPNYDPLLEIADSPTELVAYLDLLLCAQQLSDQTKQNITTALSKIPSDEDDGFLPRVHLAILMVMSSPDYLVQK
ncbi:hypothetical protein N480_12565 [Pseudoalteromonas luteoviolacea S2607]|uniref:DUF1800 domain-containing protein n=1 Tax=Pseudoalteromonas luteoviolacea TaxID=43657 RepID=UPI0007B0B6B9|nr:DUF1800 family protein [Pseudoalteromonas luteoviolacea]KZN38479.1 hypothetical protein N480_12565 [Pseudoalteromonas luteoviolacea S2607]